ncbi:uncharacterized protein N7483_007755 [Penicillium malachiteum]|uniref:uncharacterized protein n=1 Tax=Penicillium malachiteum TaxID=1324776 RepID=UPI002548517D|nr:uncharacterized protein N7483_007755 [Penicillium malachiteum]KAJ5726398.1 hypothetical protein N7483_007755 [Penicillium malachiteum]
MTIQVVVPNLEKNYPRRRDRLHEEPSAKNAQGLFPPDACIFVGNLSTKVCTDDLAEDLKKVFTEFGQCHVKIKQDKKKRAARSLCTIRVIVLCCMTGGFVSRERKEENEGTAGLGLRSGAPITVDDLSFALEGRGPVEAYCFESYLVGPQIWALICKVTFAYVDDCRDAIKMVRNNNNTRYNNARVYRNQQNRAGYRGVGWRPSFRPLQQQQQPESQSSPYLRDHFPVPPIWMNGTQYNHEAHQPVYPPPQPHLNSFYGPPPLVVHGQPIFDHLPSPPDMYLSPSLAGPFIINSPLQYDGSMSALNHEAFPPHGGFPSLSSGNISQHGGYSNQQAYDGQGAYAATFDHQPPPHEQHQTTPPPKNCEMVKDKAAEDTGIEKLLELNKPEAPPKLIRVGEFDCSTTTKKKEQLEPVKEEDEDGNETQATELTCDSASISDSSSSRSSHRYHYRLDKNCKNDHTKHLGKEYTPSFSRSRSCSRPSSMIAYYAPSSPASDICLATQTTPTKTIDEYVRYQAPTKQDLSVSENVKRDVVIPLEAEQVQKQKTEPFIDSNLFTKISLTKFFHMG